MKIDRDYITALFEHGIDLTNRRVFLDDEIDEEIASKVVRGLYLMEIGSSRNPIEVFISTYGGSVYDMNGIYDIMNTVKCPVHTFAYSKCMSAGILLLAAGTLGHRWIGPNTTFMHHSVESELEGVRLKLKADVHHMDELESRRFELLANHSSKDAKFWRDRASRQADVYFTAEEAIEWGIADHIWVEK